MLKKALLLYAIGSHCFASHITKESWQQLSNIIECPMPDFNEHFFPGSMEHPCNDIERISSSAQPIKKAPKETFTCEIANCEKSFAKKSQLDAHLRAHLNQKPFICVVCNAAFTERTNLKNHTAAIHTNEKKFNCTICEKGFVTKAAVDRHQLTHSKERPFKCELCQKGFGQKGHLKRHLEGCEKKNLNR